jgi:hypothetical protein
LLFYQFWRKLPLSLAVQFFQYIINYYFIRAERGADSVSITIYEDDERAIPIGEAKILLYSAGYPISDYVNLSKPGGQPDWPGARARSSP